MELEAEIAKIDAGRLVNLSRMGNKYPAQFTVFLLYSYCISIVLVYLCIMLNLC